MFPQCLPSEMRGKTSLPMPMAIVQSGPDMSYGSAATPDDKSRPPNVHGLMAGSFLRRHSLRFNGILLPPRLGPEGYKVHHGSRTAVSDCVQHEARPLHQGFRALRPVQFARRYLVQVAHTRRPCCHSALAILGVGKSSAIYGARLRYHFAQFPRKPSDKCTQKRRNRVDCLVRLLRARTRTGP